MGRGASSMPPWLVVTTELFLRLPMAASIKTCFCFVRVSLPHKGRSRPRKAEQLCVLAPAGQACSLGTTSLP